MNLHIDLDGPVIIRLTVSATRLDASCLAPLSAFLAADTSAHVFGLSVLERWGVEGMSGAEWWGVFGDDGALRTVAFAGEWRAERGFGLVVPMGDADGASSLGAALGARGGAAWVVGELAVSDAVWDGMGMGKPRIRSKQLLLEAQAVVAGPLLPTRLATLGDLEWVHTAARQMLIDDLKIDPVAEDAVGFARQIESAVSAGSEHVAVHDEVLVYRAKVGPVGSLGAQIGGIWVPPAARNRGVGQAGTRSVVTELLRSYPRVTLHVRADNAAAIQCYMGVGFSHVRDFRLLVR